MARERGFSAASGRQLRIYRTGGRVATVGFRGRRHKRPAAAATTGQANSSVWLREQAGLLERAQQGTGSKRFCVALEAPHQQRPEVVLCVHLNCSASNLHSCGRILFANYRVRGRHTRLHCIPPRQNERAPANARCADGIQCQCTPPHHFRGWPAPAGQVAGARCALPAEHGGVLVGCQQQLQLWRCPPPDASCRCLAAVLWGWTGCSQVHRRFRPPLHRSWCEWAWRRGR